MSLKATLDSLLSRAAEAQEVPGVAFTVTDRDTTLYEGAFGVRVLGEEAPMTPDTVVWIASMTKALVGAAAMQQVERGALSLDAPASEVVPEIAEIPVLEGYSGDGTPRTRPPKRPITLRHLLTHTSGFAYEFWSEDVVRCQQALGLPAIISCENRALRTPLLFDPGERWEYGIGIDWAGKMVEAVTGQRLGRYLAENLFGPLGMNDTAFRLTPSMRQRLAKIHQRDAQGKLTPTDVEIPQDPEFEMGGGGLYGTVIDYLKFVRMMLNEGRAGDERVLKPETVALMSRNAMDTDCQITLLRAHMPTLTHDAEFFPGLAKGWGLSFMINDEPAPTGRSPGSLAWAGLANSYYWIDQSRGVGGVYATQIFPFADEKSLSLYLAAEKAVYDAGTLKLVA